MKPLAQLAFGLAVFLNLTAHAQPATTFRIEKVVIEGNSRIETDAIRLQLTKTSGLISSADINKDIKTLYQTGFFDQVAASMVSAGPGKSNILKYNVIEKPVVRKIFIQGNEEVSESDLVDVLKFGPGRFMDKTKADSLVRSAVALYQGRGFYDAALTYGIVPVGDNQVDVTFHVTEGEKFKIRRVEVRGLKELDDSDVLGVMQTKRYKWWNSWLVGTGRLNREMLDNDKALMRQFFLDKGYIDATISDPVIEREAKGILISFEVQEGPRYKIGSLKVSGDLMPGGSEETIEGIESEAGGYFSAGAIRQDSFKISDKFTDRGYAFANVVPNTSVRREVGEVDIDFNISQGKPVSVNQISIRGNLKTYENVIRRDLKIVEQEQYSSSKVKRSQQLLERLGLFDEVSIATEPTTRDDQIDLVVNVREGSTGSFSAGAGFSSSDGALFNARVGENNLFGTGRSLSLNADIGTERDNLILSYNDRRFNDTHVAFGSDLFKTDREFSDFDRSLKGGNLEFGYPVEEWLGERYEDITASIKYEYNSIDISDVDPDEAAQLVIDSEGTSTSSSFIPKLTRNTINNPLNPTSGSRQILSFEMAGFGGNEDFYLIEARNTWYYPLAQLSWGDLVFSWRTTVGYGESNDDDDFPLFRRYFPGGINSVRGFKSRSLGPKDEEGNEYGGSKELVNNFDFIFPLVNSAGLKGVIFYDAGQAFDDDVDIDINDLRRAYGAGIRWNSPLGPIRVEFGFPEDPEEDEKSMVTMFSFGAPL